MKPLEVLETCLYVDDLAAAERFYVGVLGFEFVSRQAGRHVFLRCGSTMLLLFEPTASGSETSDLPRHGTVGAGHVAFSAAADELDDWASRLNDEDIAIEQIVDWPGGCRSIYFRDPAGNSVEIATRELWKLPPT